MKVEPDEFHPASMLVTVRDADGEPWTFDYRRDEEGNWRVGGIEPPAMPENVLPFVGAIVVDRSDLTAALDRLAYIVRGMVVPTQG